MEDVYLALRTDQGLPEAACPPDRRSAWTRAGWVSLRDHRIVCSPEGWLRLDALVRDLTGAPETA
jgi:hypothetical protein